jgi:hypothetical protein
MYKTDPMLAFCLAVTLLSLAGNFKECQSMYLINVYSVLMLYTKRAKCKSYNFHSYLFYLFLDQFVRYFNLNYLPRLNALHYWWSKSPIYKFIIRYFVYSYILFYNSVYYFYISYEVLKNTCTNLYTLKKYPYSLNLIIWNKSSISKSVRFESYSNRSYNS